MLSLPESINDIRIVGKELELPDIVMQMKIHWPNRGQG